MNVFKIMVLAPIFIILLVVIFKPIKSAFNLDTFPSCVLSVCVSLLGVIGMDHYLKGSVEVILLPYATMAIAIILTLLFSFMGKRSEEKGSKYKHKQKKKVETNLKMLKK